MGEKERKKEAEDEAGTGSSSIGFVALKVRASARGVPET